MALNLYTGKTYLSFDDLRALAVAYQHMKLDLLPTLSDGRRKTVERGLEIIQDYWVERKIETAPYSYDMSSDPIRWLNT